MIIKVCRSEYLHEMKVPIWERIQQQQQQQQQQQLDELEISMRCFESHGREKRVRVRNGFLTS